MTPFIDEYSASALLDMAISLPRRIFYCGILRKHGRGGCSSLNSGHGCPSLPLGFDGRVSALPQSSPSGSMVSEEIQRQAVFLIVAAISGDAAFSSLTGAVTTYFQNRNSKKPFHIARLIPMMDSFLLGLLLLCELFQQRNHRHPS